MTGLLLVALAAIWFTACALLVRALRRRVAAPAGKMALGSLLMPLLLVLPVLDELVGMWQFKELCSKYSVQFIDKDARNTKAVYVPQGPNQFAAGTMVSIRIDPVVYRDAASGKILVSYHTLHAQGGWLIQALGLSQTNGPLLFSGGCAPKDQDAFKKNLNITVIN